VSIPAGSTSATFTITTSAVGASTQVTISGTYITTHTTALTITPAAFSTLTLSPNSVVNGSSTTGTLTLNGPAPAGGAAISLGSSNTTNANVPPSATVPTGSTTVTFTVTTGPVHATSAVISGTYGAFTRRATLIIR
jgi:hypothetical protein